MLIHHKVQWQTVHPGKIVMELVIAELVWKKKQNKKKHEKYLQFLLILDAAKMKIIQLVLWIMVLYRTM